IAFCRLAHLTEGFVSLAGISFDAISFPLAVAFPVLGLQVSKGFERRVRLSLLDQLAGNLNLGVGLWGARQRCGDALRDLGREIGELIGRESLVLVNRDLGIVAENVADVGLIRMIALGNAAVRADAYGETRE